MMMKFVFITLFGLLVGMCSWASGEGRIYVKANGGDNSLDGCSWNNAVQSLDSALIRASRNTAITEIWVAQGTYKPSLKVADNDSEGNSTTSRDCAFTLVKNVKIYGGFEGDETSISQRSYATTILSGDIGSVGDNSDNCYHVVISVGNVGTALLDGFIISGGNANGLLTININDDWPIEQSDGGGINFRQTSPTLNNVTLRGNSATNSGGGMHNDWASYPILTNVIISGNFAGIVGGGIYNARSSPTLINVIISGNFATSSGGGMRNFISSPTITNSIIWGNVASSHVSIYNTQTSSPVYAYSLVEGSGGSSNWNVDFGNDNGNNIDSDPLFVNWLNPSESGWTFTTNGDYHLLEASSCFNIGINDSIPSGVTTDIEGNARIKKEIVDLGAYESQYGINPTNGVLYVNESGSNAENGSSWSHAIDLSTAFFWARRDTTVEQIWVAKGTYKPSKRVADFDSEDEPTTDRDCAFTLVENVKIYGGFDGNETSLSERVDTPGASTILSGDIGALNDSTDNCYHVVISAGDVGSALLNGFTITGGNADDLGNISFNKISVYRQQGGGLYLYNSSPSISNLIIGKNTAVKDGGGLFCVKFSKPSLNYVEISGNSAGVLGGGMCVCNAHPSLNHVTISGNFAGTSGGGIFSNDASPKLENIKITGNHSDNDGGGIYFKNFSSPSLTHVEIRGNSAKEDGGGMCADYYTSPELNDVIISGNSASLYGGGVCNKDNSFPTFTNVIIQGNSSAYGGGMCTHESIPVLTNVLFSGNIGTNNGGGLYNFHSSPKLVNVTISGNSAGTSGGGIYNYWSSTPSFSNSIIWGNTASSSSNVYANSSGKATYSYCLVEGSGGSSNWDSYFGTDKGNNIDGDPLFVNWLNPAESSWTYTTDGDYHLLQGSFCVNVGSNDSIPEGVTTDLDGYARIKNETVDMGVYEWGNEEVPNTLSIAGETYLPNTETCNGALETITVAGDAGEVWVADGASVNFIAGESICFLPGFHAKAGSNVNAWISSNKIFCEGIMDSSVPIFDVLTEKSIEVEGGDELMSEMINEKQVKLYPNPNKGQFSLYLDNFDNRTDIRVFNLSGKIIYNDTAYSPQHVDIDMTNAPQGVYSVLVSDHNTLKTIKMVIY